MCVIATANRSSVMEKSICHRKAVRYRSLAETARSELYRSMLLTIASEWDAMADTAATRSNPVVANQPYGATA